MVPGVSFELIRGQSPAVQTLTRALERGRVHHAYRFEGPAGVGKELTAFRLAAALVCEKGGLGCDQCSACRRALSLSDDEPQVPLHPDVVLIGRGVYRSVTGQAEATGIGIEQIRRVVQPRIGYTPHEGRALVFIVREAEELTPQAANALLKTLEEPPRQTYFVLVSSRPHRLLDTIRSRTLPIRFGTLSDSDLAALLAERELSAEVVPFAEGSMQLAIERATPEALAEREEFVSEVEAAIEAPDFARALRFAETQKGERDVVKRRLLFFAHHLSMKARTAAAEGRPGAGGSSRAEAERQAFRHGKVLDTIADLEQNVQPALALEAMLLKMREG
jgi:DNA polymerase-3 subunit delta'